MSLASLDPNFSNLQFADRGSEAAAPLLLSIRAARRAALASPDDARAQRVLAEAYRNLLREHELPWSTGAPGDAKRWETTHLRQVQLAAALQQAVRAYPDNDDLHRQMFEYFVGLGFWDYALDHLQAVHRILQASKPTGRDRQEEVGKELEFRKKQIDELQGQVQKQRNEYELQSKDQPVGVKAVYALSHGLARQARDLFVGADANQLNVEDLTRYLDLLLAVGEIDLLRDGLQPELQPRLGPSYNRFRWLLAAADGNYADAGKYLDNALRQVRRQGAEVALQSLRALALGGEMGPIPFLQLQAVPMRVQEAGLLHVLRGQLAVEAGDIPTAEHHFREAVAQSESGTSVPLAFNGRALAIRYLRLIESAK
jgi:hypothetical protein